MSESILQIDCRSLCIGWESNLPGAEFAAWVKLLQTVCVFGLSGGRISVDDVDDCYLRTIHIPRDSFSAMLEKAEANGAVSVEGGYIVIESMRGSAARSNADYKKWRRAVLKRDGYKCQHKRCTGHSQTLCAHHIEPFSTHPESRYDVENGIVYCEDCHKLLRGKGGLL